MPAPARHALICAADELIAGHWESFGVARTDVMSPDWFRDPVTGRRSPAGRYAFRINHRSEEETGNIKQVWELSRHHHLTLLAAAWFLTRRDIYADRVADQLQSWWRENPFLSGVHWTSGIELGIRLISWTWIRRLLDEWPGVSELFENNDLAVQQIFWHQEYLSVFRSRGSSANNHVIAEAAGRLVASCAFPWYAQSDRWCRSAARLLVRELEANTHPSGVNRELASDYHGFVAELGLLAAVEADAAGRPLAPDTWARLSSIIDVAAAIVDEQVQPPRQGDSDEGIALLLDSPEPGWRSLLSLGGALYGPLPWWPSVSADVRSVLVGALVQPRLGVDGRPQRRPSHFPDAGISVLRTPVTDGPEIWCRCDGGPHGFLSTAAHAHADALSVEVRYGGVDVLADPGTYCYHGNPRWRTYFRSTLAHNTIEIGGRSQSVEAGPFLWSDHANATVVDVLHNGPGVTSWTAVHDGYLSMTPPVQHVRTVLLDGGERALEIVDRIDGAAGCELRMAFHLGPQVLADLTDHVARLCWETAGGTSSATMTLPDRLCWSVHRGSSDPILGWFSPGFGRKVASTTLVGSGRTEPGRPLVSRIDFSKSDIADRW